MIFCLESKIFSLQKCLVLKNSTDICARDDFNHSALDCLLTSQHLWWGLNTACKNSTASLTPHFLCKEKGVLGSSTQLLSTAVVSLHGMSQTLPCHFLCGFPGNSQILVYKHISRASKSMLWEQPNAFSFWAEVLLAELLARARAVQQKSSSRKTLTVK